MTGMVVTTGHAVSCHNQVPDVISTGRGKGTEETTEEQKKEADFSL